MAVPRLLKRGLGESYSISLIFRAFSKPLGIQSGRAAWTARTVDLFKGYIMVGVFGRAALRTIAHQHDTECIILPHKDDPRRSL